MEVDHGLLNPGAYGPTDLEIFSSYISATPAV
jgi:hypothetical protein